VLLGLKRESGGQPYFKFANILFRWSPRPENILRGAAAALVQ